MKHQCLKCGESFASERGAADCYASHGRRSVRGPSVNAREARKIAQRGLQMIRDYHGRKDGCAYAVGAAWSLFAQIAGDNSPPPWDVTVKQAVVEHSPTVRS